MKNVIKRPGDLVARYGGEEFVIVLPNTDSIGAQKLGDELITAIAKFKIPHVASTIENYVTISLGVTTIIPTPDIPFHSIIKNADNALYKAKKSGRNRLFVV